MAMRDRIRRYRTVALWLGIILATIWGLSWGLGREQWGPFRGQIVDVETGRPIADAAVLVIWWEVVATPIEGKRKFYDAREAVTDGEGRFEIPGLSVPFWKFGIQPGEVHYFAPGYDEHARVVTPPDGQLFVDPTVVQMRRLKTREELLKKSRGRPAGVPQKKMLKFIKAVNVERKTLGFPPIPIEPTPQSQP